MATRFVRRERFAKDPGQLGTGTLAGHLVFGLEKGNRATVARMPRFPAD